MKYISFFSKTIQKVVISLILFVSTTVLCQTNIDKQLLNAEKNFIDGNYDIAKNELDNLLKSNYSDKINQVKIYVYYVDLFCNKGDIEKALHYTNLSKQISDNSPTKLDDAYTNYALAKVNNYNQIYVKTIEFGNKTLKDLKSSLMKKYYIQKSTF